VKDNIFEENLSSSKFLHRLGSDSQLEDTELKKL